MGLLDFNLNNVGSLITGIREAITGEKIKDPATMARIDLQLSQLENGLKTGQLKINEAEATNPHIFVAGWRPFIGWVGGLALAYQFLLYPLIVWGWAMAGKDLSAAPPSLDASELYSIISSMLGMGAARTFEKLRNISTTQIGSK